jgi:hypothetical protein
MKIETNIKVAVNGFVCLACLILCGCCQEQSYCINKRHYFVPLEGFIDASNRPGETDETYKQEEIKRYALLVHEALNHVHKHSTEQMKKNISRGKLVIGMNQKEVLACLHAANYREGVPVPSRTFNSKYGKYETWIVGGSSGDQYSSYSPPAYALDFNCFILTGIHEPLDALVKTLSDSKTPGSNNTYFKDAYETMGKMCYVLHSFEDEHEEL